MHLHCMLRLDRCSTTFHGHSPGASPEDDDAFPEPASGWGREPSLQNALNDRRLALIEEEHALECACELLLTAGYTCLGTAFVTQGLESS